ncbi:MAG: hypothetical protein C6Y22_27145 [Hapalosiphonaceae cyanobacterium JJU2]|nr:MAG: hypothetical protein C6Y22_27145 [Hapalosiphonaceae cyanobacterium JJU2]
MIVGMLFKQIYDYVSINQDDDISLVTLGRIIRRRTTIQALVVSPIVFYTIYNSLSLLNDNVVYTLFAFQNGFFWQSIFTRIENATNEADRMTAERHAKRDKLS